MKAPSITSPKKQIPSSQGMDDAGMMEAADEAAVEGGNPLSSP